MLINKRRHTYRWILICMSVHMYVCTYVLIPVAVLQFSQAIKSKKNSLSFVLRIDSTQCASELLISVHTNGLMYVCIYTCTHAMLIRYACICFHYIFFFSVVRLFGMPTMACSSLISIYHQRLQWAPPEQKATQIKNRNEGNQLPLAATRISYLRERGVIMLCTLPQYVFKLIIRRYFCCIPLTKLTIFTVLLSESKLIP